MPRRYYIQVYNNNELIFFGSTTGPEALVPLSVPLEENAQEIWNNIVDYAEHHYSTYHIKIQVIKAIPKSSSVP